MVQCTLVHTRLWDQPPVPPKKRRQGDHCSDVTLGILTEKLALCPPSLRGPQRREALVTVSFSSTSLSLLGSLPLWLEKAKD